MSSDIKEECNLKKDTLISDDTVDNTSPKIEDINVDIKFKNEQVVDNGSTLATIHGNKSTMVRLQIPIGSVYKDFTYSANYVRSDKAITLEKLKNIYSEAGNSIDVTYDSLKEMVVANPENIATFFADLLGSFTALCDNDNNYYDFGDAKNTLNRILQCGDEETIDGFVCMGIHEFGMKLLHDCNIPAIVLCGSNSIGGNHATLLFQSPDGKFVYNDYGTAITIDAPSLIDAAKVVYKKSCDIESSGYITFIDENNSYQKFAFEQEALWSNELDKMDYNKTSPFSNPITSSKTNLSGDIQVSNTGNIETTVTGNKVYGNNNKVRQLSLSLGYKNNAETALFNQSMATGIKAEFNGITGNTKGNETFFETKAVVQGVIGERNKEAVEDIELKPVSNIDDTFTNFLTEQGVTDPTPYLSFLGNFSVRELGDAYIQKSNNLTTFLRGTFGKQNTLMESDNLKLDNIGKASLYGGVTIVLPGQKLDCYAQGNNIISVTSSSSIFGDARATIEDGLGLTSQGRNWQMQNNLSIGYVADLKLTGGEEKGGIQSGVKLNAGTSFITKPKEETTLGADVEGHVIALRPYQDYGTSASLFVSQEISPQKSIYGNAIFEKDIQNLSIGGFSGRSYDKTIFGATIGTQIKNANIYAGYQKTINEQNRTYDNSIITVGAKINF